MADLDERVALLASVDLLAGIRREDLAALAAASVVEEHRPGTAVVREGEPGDALHVLVAGTARVVVRGRPRRDLRPGDHFGEIALLDGGLRSASVYAIDPLTTLRLPGEPFARLLAQRPDLAAPLIAGLCRRLRSLESDRWAEAEELRLRRLQGTFLANIGHELRTPLTTALGFLQLARRQIDDPESLGRLLASSEAGLQSLRTVVDDLLELVAARSGGRELDVERYPLALLVDGAVGMAGLDAGRVDTDLPDGVTIEADGARITRVLAALLENAEKFGPDGGRIAVRARVDDDQVRLDVVDEGAGIPVDDRQHIFDAFAQRDASATRAQGGLGLGLPLARSLARLHGGELVLVEDAATTTFRILLPASD